MKNAIYISLTWYRTPDHTLRALKSSIFVIKINKKTKKSFGGVEFSKKTFQNFGLNKPKNQFWKMKFKKKLNRFSKIDCLVYLNQTFWKSFLSNSVLLKYSQFFFRSLRPKLTIVSGPSSSNFDTNRPGREGGGVFICPGFFRQT